MSEVARRPPVYNSGYKYVRWEGVILTWFLDAWRHASPSPLVGASAIAKSVAGTHYLLFHSIRHRYVCVDPLYYLPRPPTDTSSILVRGPFRSVAAIFINHYLFIVVPRKALRWVHFRIGSINGPPPIRQLEQPTFVFIVPRIFPHSAFKK